MFLNQLNGGFMLTKGRSQRKNSINRFYAVSRGANIHRAWRLKHRKRFFTPRPPKILKKKKNLP